MAEQKNAIAQPARRIRKTARYNGKKYEATGKTELEALRKLAAMLEAAERGEISSNSTVDAWYAQWLELYKRPKGLTEKSFGMYDEKYNKYIKPAIGRMKLKDVRDVHLQKILNDQAGMSESHVTKVRRVIRELFSRARKSRLIPYDPSEDLQLPNYAKGSHRSITAEERKTMLAVAPNSRAGFWVVFLLYTGLRPGEAAALSWEDIDLSKKEIHVHSAVESGSSRIKAPKTESGVRDVPIRDALVPWLTQRQGAPKSPVFPTQTGGRQNSGSMARLWKTFKRDMDIALGAKMYRNQIIESKVAEDLTPYCLRHTFCTDLQRAGVPINIAKELMGHADIQTTANIYTHKDNETLHRSMELLDGGGGTSGGN